MMRNSKYLNGDCRDSVGMVLANDGVVSENDDVGLDLLRHALGPHRRHAQPHRRRAGQEQQEEDEPP